MINWQFYPKSMGAPRHLIEIVRVFENNYVAINSEVHTLSSDAVLEIIRPSLEKLDFEVEKSKRSVDKIHVPVLYGRNGTLEKSFNADAYDHASKTVIEVEAGRAVVNYQFLKDLFQACMMDNVEHLVIAVRNTYRNGKDFEKVLSFFNTLYASSRLNLPLKGVLIIGY